MVLAKVKFNKKDCDYLVMESKEIENLVCSREVLPAINEMAKSLYIKKCNYVNKIEEECKVYLESGIYSNLMRIPNYVAVEKDSAFGQFLMNDDRIIKEDTHIYYTKVVSAFNVAVLAGDNIAEALKPLFKNRIQGSKKELLAQGIKEYVLDYILEHDNFEIYLASLDGNHREEVDEECLVYNSCLTTKTFSQLGIIKLNKNKVKKYV